jgi:hypothetical protein
MVDHSWSKWNQLKSNLLAMWQIVDRMGKETTVAV